MNHLRTIRENKGLTQAELAEKVGLSQARISDLELGLRPDFRKEQPGQIAMALGVTVHDIWPNERIGR